MSPDSLADNWPGAFRRILHLLITSSELELLAKRILMILQSELPVRAGAFYEYRSGSNTLVLVANLCYPEKVIEEVEKLAVEMRSERQAVRAALGMNLLHSAKHQPDTPEALLLSTTGGKSLVSIPLYHDRYLLGLIQLVMDIENFEENFEYFTRLGEELSLGLTKIKFVTELSARLKRTLRILDELPFGVALLSSGGHIKQSTRPFREMLGVGISVSNGIDISDFLLANEHYIYSPLFEEFKETLLGASSSSESKPVPFRATRGKTPALEFFTKRITSDDVGDDDTLVILSPFSKSDDSSILEKRLSIIESETKDAILYFNREGYLERTSKRGLEFIGVDSPEAAAGKKLSDFPVSSLSSSLSIFFDRTIKTGEPSRFKMESGDRIFEISILPVTDNENQIHSFILISRDITENFSSQKYEFLAAATREQFFRNISHELLTPLNCITGFSELLLSEELSSTQREIVEHILSNSRDLMTLISQILALAELEQGKSSSSSNICNIQELIESVFNEFKKSGTDKSLELFLIKPDKKIPPLRCDEKKIKQILSCLLSNAVKFTATGSITLSWDLEHGENYMDARLVINIEDTGIGIPDEVKHKIFEPFFQADGSPTRKFGGLGVGLAIVKQSLELLGGSIDVRSKPGKGSSFLIRVPVTAVLPEN